MGSYFIFIDNFHFHFFPKLSYFAKQYTYIGTHDALYIYILQIFSDTYHHNIIYLFTLWGDDDGGNDKGKKIDKHKLIHMNSIQQYR